MKFTEEDIYRLRAEEFEELCARNIKEFLPGIKQIQYGSRGVGFFANDGKVAIEIKHKNRLTQKEIDKSFTLLSQLTTAEHFIIITSAPSNEIDMPIVDLSSTTSGLKMVFGLEDILKALNSSAFVPLEIEQAYRREKREVKELLISIVVAIISGLAIFGTNVNGLKDKPPLEKRIENVEVVIRNLKDLEGQLEGIKEDMIKTQDAKRVIESEYAKAKELEKLTSEQLEGLKSVIKSQTWKEMLWQYGLGFILGVASSVAGSILYSRFRQRKALED